MRDLPTFVIASQNGNSIFVANFQSNKQRYLRSFQYVITKDEYNSVDKYLDTI